MFNSIALLIYQFLFFMLIQIATLITCQKKTTVCPVRKVGDSIRVAAPLDIQNSSTKTAKLIQEHNKDDRSQRLSKRMKNKKEKTKQEEDAKTEEKKTKETKEAVKTAESQTKKKPERTQETGESRESKYQTAEGGPKSTKPAVVIESVMIVEQHM